MYAAATTNIPRALVLSPHLPLLFSSRFLPQKGAVHLLSRILNTDPEKRSTVHEIRLHAWCVAEHPLPASFRPTAAAPNPAVPTLRSELNDKLLARALDLVKGGSDSRSGDAEPPSPSAAALEAAADSASNGTDDAATPE